MDPVFSRLGGLPVLPAAQPWPEWKAKPQAFLAQIDLGEINAACDSFLPGTGQLFFFYDQEQSAWGFDPKDLGAWQVLYTDDDRSMFQERAAPAALPEDCIFHPKPVAAHRIDLLPDAQRLPKSDYEWNRDGEAYQELRTLPFADARHHQMLGYPSPIQNDDMELECQLASHGIHVGNADGIKDPRVADLKRGAGDWKLLLQLDTDDDTGWMWGDVGTLYFWIREQDARNRDFGKVWMISQCC